MSNIHINPISNRQKVYAAKVAEFITNHGPLFKLLNVERNDSGDVCDCCGYHPIKAVFNVRGQDGDYKIGSECQLFVLGTEGVVPANKLRTLHTDVLLVMAMTLGVDVTGLGPKTLAEAIIDVRRSKANRLGWESRRVQGKVATKVVQAPAELIQ